MIRPLLGKVVISVDKLNPVSLFNCSSWVVLSFLRVSEGRLLANALYTDYTQVYLLSVRLIRLLNVRMSNAVHNYAQTQDCIAHIIYLSKFWYHSLILHVLLNLPSALSSYHVFSHKLFITLTNHSFWSSLLLAENLSSTTSKINEHTYAKQIHGMQIYNVYQRDQHERTAYFSSHTCILCMICELLQISAGFFLLSLTSECHANKELFIKLTDHYPDYIIRPG